MNISLCKNKFQSIPVVCINIVSLSTFDYTHIHTLHVHSKIIRLVFILS